MTEDVKEFWLKRSYRTKELRQERERLVILTKKMFPSISLTFTQCLDGEMWDENHIESWLRSKANFDTPPETIMEMIDNGQVDELRARAQRQYDVSIISMIVSGGVSKFALERSQLSI